MEGMRKRILPKDLSSDIAERLDGFLDDAEGLESIKHPGLDDLIANLVDGVESWYGDLGEHGRGTTESGAVWDVVCKLELISILAKLRGKQLSYLN